MICLNCFHVKTSVTNSRPHKQPSVWRRRHCKQCGVSFTTYERPSLEDQQVLGRDNTHTPFSIGKLTISIARGFQHNKASADQHSFVLARTVETKLLLRAKSPSADDIAAITHETLKHFDPVAALQYAAQHDLVTTTRRPGRPSLSFAADRPDQPSSSR